jgi:predicted ArsR family transcriptional regulator
VAGGAIVSALPEGLEISSTQAMKHIEKLTLATATAVYAGYLIQQAIRTRSERFYRLAAGESPYERTHPKPRSIRKS